MNTWKVAILIFAVLGGTSSLRAFQTVMPGPMSMQEEYSAIPNGARLTLTAKDPAKLKEFRAAVRTRVEAMKKGDCSMMHEMMQGMRMSGKTGAS